MDFGTKPAADASRSFPPEVALHLVKIACELPDVLEDVDRMVEENFRSEIFVSPAVIEAETQERLDAVLRPALVVEGATGESASGQRPVESRPRDVFA